MLFFFFSFLFCSFAGLSAELYYVRDGVVNEYALHFNVPVAANVRDIAFTWQSLAGRPVTPTSTYFFFFFYIHIKFWNKRRGEIQYET